MFAFTQPFSFSAYAKPFFLIFFYSLIFDDLWFLIFQPFLDNLSPTMLAIYEIWCYIATLQHCLYLQNFSFHLMMLQVFLFFLVFWCLLNATNISDFSWLSDACFMLRTFCPLLYFFFESFLVLKWSFHRWQYTAHDVGCNLWCHTITLKVNFWSLAGRKIMISTVGFLKYLKHF